MVSPRLPGDESYNIYATKYKNTIQAGPLSLRADGFISMVHLLKLTQAHSAYIVPARVTNSLLFVTEGKHSAHA